MTYYFFGNQTNQPSEALLAKAGIISNKKGQERDQPRVYLSQTRKQEVKEAIDAGALTVMINSGEVNGIPGHIVNGIKYFKNEMSEDMQN